MKKILHTIYRLSNGGAEKQLIHLVNNSKNCQHAIFCVDSSNKHLLNNKVNLYSMYRKSKIDLNIFKEISKTIENYKPDIIHTWLPHYVTIPSLFLSKKNDIPLVYSYRSSRYFRNVKDLIEYFFIMNYSNKIVSNNDIIFSSRFYRYLFKKKNGEVIHNGYPIEKIRKKSRSENKIIKNNKFKLLFVGRLVSLKNIDFLIEGFNRLSNKNEFHLYICGKGPLKSQLNNKINKLGLNNHITLLGFREDVYSIMKMSNLLILPSKYEGMSNVIFEAMAVGLPVLVSNIKQNKKWIQHNKTGFIFDLKDINDLTSKIIKIKNNKVIYERVKVNQKKFIEKFDINHMVSKYENLYNNL